MVMIFDNCIGPLHSLLVFMALWYFYSDICLHQVMPGLLLCFVLRYDTYKKSQLTSVEAGVPPPPNYVQRISYFHCSLIGYFLGMFVWRLEFVIRREEVKRFEIAKSAKAFMEFRYDKTFFCISFPLCGYSNPLCVRCSVMLFFFN